MRLVASFLLIAAALMLANSAAWNIFYAWRGADVKTLARIIESRGPSDNEGGRDANLNAEYFAQFERDNPLDYLSKLCVDDLSRSTLTVRLASLGSALPPAPQNEDAGRASSVATPHLHPKLWRRARSQVSSKLSQQSRTIWPHRCPLTRQSWIEGLPLRRMPATKD